MVRISMVLSLCSIGLIAGCDGTDESLVADVSVDAQSGAVDAQTDVTDMRDVHTTLDVGVEVDSRSGCQDSNECEDGQVCFENQCVGCRDDTDCVDGYICEATSCTAGCRVENDTCPQREICRDSQCVPGCMDRLNCAPNEICLDEFCVVGCEGNEECPLGQICTENECLPGCRGDAECGVASVCEMETCTDGCRDDMGCEAMDLCLNGQCEARGLRCREDADCPDGMCVEGGFCMAVGPNCTDALEPNDVLEMASPIEAGRIDGLRICMGDVDLFTLNLEAGQRIRIAINFGVDLGEITAELRLMNAEPLLTGGLQAPTGLIMLYDIGETGLYSVRVAGLAEETEVNYLLDVEVLNPVPMCVDTPVYADGDGDGFGEGEAVVQCIVDDMPEAGFSAVDGDCAPGDAWRNPEASEICNDHLDDNCDGIDGACPETQPGVMVPDWNCQGDPPNNVFAWARFADGAGYFNDGGCFIFFEGVANEFYVKRHLVRASDDPSCEQRNGCVCPSLNDWPSYDRRLYAFTTAGEPEECPEIGIVDHGGEIQPVSNDCRKYLYQLHFYDIPFSYIATGRADMERRLDLFPTVEVACAADLPHRNLPYQKLLTASIERNAGFVPQP